jgi:hypothetical protein
METLGTALILAVDGSASVTFEEFGLIAGGLAVALRDPDVITAMTHEGAWLAVLLFSGAGEQDVVAGWTRIGKPAELAAFANRVESMPRSLRPGLTAIGDALLAARALFADMPGQAGRRIIDVAGDGSSNDGTAPGSRRELRERGDRRSRFFCAALRELRRFCRGAEDEAAARARRLRKKARSAFFEKTKQKTFAQLTSAFPQRPA